MSAWAKTKEEGRRRETRCGSKRALGVDREVRALGSDTDHRD